MAAPKIRLVFSGHDFSRWLDHYYCEFYVGSLPAPWQKHFIRSSVCSAFAPNGPAIGSAYTATLICFIRGRDFGPLDLSDQLTVTRNKDGAVLRSVIIPILPTDRLKDRDRLPLKPIWSKDSDSVSFDFMSPDSKEVEYTLVIGNIKQKDAQTAPVVPVAQAPKATPRSGEP